MVTQAQERDRINALLEGSAWDRALSALGRRVAYPKGVPFQAGQAKGKRINASIGQIKGDDGHAAPLPVMAKALAGLERDPAFLYSPMPGFPELRSLWRERQLAEAEVTIGRRPALHQPHVTVGLAHGLSLIADIFSDEETTVIVPGPYWGNYGQIFSLRRGARMVSPDLFADDTLNLAGFKAALAVIPGRVIFVCNFPSNPAGYSPSAEEREGLVKVLAEAAAERPVIAIADDAYHGLVYENDVPRESIFWELLDASRDAPNLLPIKVDGATKEYSFFSGRVGFLTFGTEDPGQAEALLSKTSCLLRATLGSPVGPSQEALLQALRAVETPAEQEQVRLMMAERYQALKNALENAGSEHFTALPFNSGCFTLIELAEGLDAEAVRVDLLERESTGLIRATERHLRIAYCSVPAALLPDLVAGLCRACERVSKR